MKALILSVLFISAPSMAQQFFFKNKLIPTEKYKNVAWISPSCISCLAKDVLSYVKIPKDQGPSFRGTPGSKVCKSLPNTRVAIFKSKAGEQGFCVFQDSSYIDTGGLYYFARENNKKNK